MASWEPTARSDAFDVTLAAAFGGLAAISLYMGGDPALYGEVADYDRVLGIAVVVVLQLALVPRRRYPLLCLVVATAAFLPLRLADIPEFQMASISLFLSIYTAGAYGTRHRDLVRAGVGVAIAALVLWAIFRTPMEPYEGFVPPVVLHLFTAVSNAFYVIAAWMLGDLVRHRREREAVLEAKAAALTEAQDDLARRAVLGERVRIARELHDVLAHHVSVMGVQAGAARRVLPTRPEAVPELLHSIEASSRDAVVELQRLLGLLRQAEEDDGPQPTLEALPELARQMTQAGLHVDVDLDGVPGAPVPQAVALSAYRIVQEALTNTLKHAGRGTTAAVAVHRSRSSLEVVVLDDGPGPSTPAGEGHGLIGMRERVSAHGGQLRTGRRSGGGFEVRAWFPLPA